MRKEQKSDGAMRDGLVDFLGGVRWWRHDGVPERTLSTYWSRLGGFNGIFEALARTRGKPDRLMIDATRQGIAW